MENKGDIENQSEESVGDTKLRVVTRRGGGRLKLSLPHSHNVPEPGRKTVHFETKLEEAGKKKELKKYRVLPGAGGTVSGDDSRCMENVAAGDSTGTEAEKKSLPRPVSVRKRS